MMSTAKMNPVQWFTFGERGMSSEAFMRHVYGLHDPTMSTWDRTAHPHDPADLRRCRLAMEETGSEHLLDKARTISKAWDALVTAWPKLCETMDREYPKWRDAKGSGKCPETYEMMQATLGKVGCF